MDKRGKKEKIKKYAKICLVVFLVALVLLVAACVAYGVTFKDKVLPRTYFAGKDITGFSRDALSKRIEIEQSQWKSKKIVLKKDDKKWELSFEDASWKINSDETVQSIYSYGHSSLWYENIIPEVKALLSDRDTVPIYSFDEGSIDNWISGIDAEIGSPKQEANIQVKKSVATVTESTKGEKVDEKQIKQEILEQFSLENNNEIKASIISDEPVITMDEANGLKDEAVKLTSADVELVGPKGSVTLTSASLGQMIALKKDIQEKKFLQDVKLGPAYVSFNSDKIRDFLSKESDNLNIDPSDARFTIVDGKVTLLANSTDGKVVKTDDAVKLIVSQLEKGQTKKIVLPEENDLASISAQETADISKYGIEELIATGSTSFKGSPDNRIQNIKLGVKFISGTLIAPGEEFSTIAHLGAIDGSSGYLQELVIKENETIPEFGGGLCQVSTTLFRTVMNAGLEVTERHNHSYRVSYYEPPVGMDATIYSPSPDFKFRNNTDHYILIQGSVDGNTLKFDFYGKKDNRTVEITTPVMYDVTPPPADIYVDDPSLAPGETKRIDRAHDGSKAYFYYRVTKDGKTTEVKFTSSYVPWPAKYLRGPQPSQ